MANELPWFPCEPTPLLGALGGMKSPKKLVYLIMILRIYECGGSCPDTIEAISVRVGLNKRIVSDVMDELFREGRLIRGEAGIRNPKADAVIARSKALHEKRKVAGAKGGIIKAEKTKEKQSEPSSQATEMPEPTPPQLHLQEQDSLFSSENRVSDRKPKRVRAVAPEPPPDDGWPTDYLDQFWIAFPPYRREGKRKVGEKLERIRREARVPWRTIIDAVARYSASNPGEYACAPLVWLNGDRWDRVYGNNKPGGNHEANRAGPARRTYAVLAAELRYGAGAAPPGDAAGFEPGDGHRNS